MKAETFAQPSKVKELMTLAAGLPTIFQDREDVWLEGLQLLVHDCDEVGTEQCSLRGSNEATKHGKNGVMHP